VRAATAGYFFGMAKDDTSHAAPTGAKVAAAAFAGAFFLVIVAVAVIGLAAG
jgi:hypothetical protein